MRVAAVRVKVPGRAVTFSGMGTTAGAAVAASGFGCEEAGPVAAMVDRKTSAAKGRRKSRVFARAALSGNMRGHTICARQYAKGRVRSREPSLSGQATDYGAPTTDSMT